MVASRSYKRRRYHRGLAAPKTSYEEYLEEELRNAVTRIKELEGHLTSLNEK